MLNIKKNLKSLFFRNLQPTTYPPATTAVWHVGRGNLKPSKGFTLIELLVVIAIIGILSSVVLTSLTSARAKAADGAIKADLEQIKPQAQIFMSDNNSTYGAPAAVCTAEMFADTKIAAQIADAQTKSGGANNNACVSADNDSDGFADAWAVAQTFKSDINRAWCVDSEGNAKEYAIASPLTVADAVSTSGICN